MIHPIIIAYVAIYDPDDEDGADSGEDRQLLDLTGTTSGHFEVAANREHQVIDIIGKRRFGFGPPDRRA